MGKIIVGIHGLANKPEPKIETTYWHDAIAEGITKQGGQVPAGGVPFRMVHWATLLHRYPLHRDDAYQFDKNYDWEPYIPYGFIPKSRKERFTSRVAAVVGNKFDSVTDSLKVADNLSQRIADKIAVELAYYYGEGKQLKDPSTGALDTASSVLRGILARAIHEEQTKGNEIMLVAHSMGSIIAYDVLRDLGRKPGSTPVEQLVTIGSPLGLPFVKRQIAIERDYDPRPRTPSRVSGSWANFSDRLDPVAFDSHLADDYAPNDAGVTVQDDMVFNDYVGLARPGKEPKPNHHKSFGYLRAAEFTAHIRKFLGI